MASAFMQTMLQQRVGWASCMHHSRKREAPLCCATVVRGPPDNYDFRYIGSCNIEMTCLDSRCARPYPRYSLNQPAELQTPAMGRSQPRVPFVAGQSRRLLPQI